ncbi:hypothetical protein FYK55_20585 [Roseiconus nitratireducens]|uniref:Uncharacterized protein n=1 Tax=Roseiconus nitratireducens TaxID=2605748 RepID=A0A5M6CYW5_9BACT|nr:hypothetical protein [Roseiconus nitratireducens]KAA5540414.1 hypothetical protein FYK55_20585 [Roseiconus nitratireducens]
MNPATSALSRISFVAILLLLCGPATALAQQVQVQEVVQFQALVAPQAAQKKVVPEFLKSFINIELSFIHRVCDPTDKQMEKIIDAAGKAFDQMGDLVQDPNQQFFVAGQIHVFGPGNERLSQNPILRVRRDAAEYLKPVVSKEQYERYQAEYQAREEFERGVAIQIVIDLIDRRVMLTEKQRTELFKQLMDSWTNVDLLWVQNYAHNPQYAPTVPGGPIAKVLTPKQQKVWKSFNQVQMSASVGTSEQQLQEEWLK